MFKITTIPDQIVGGDHCVGNIFDANGDGYDAVHLEAHEDERTWDERADVAIAAAGYRRTGPWTREGGEITAPLEADGWEIYVAEDGHLINESLDQWAPCLTIYPETRRIRVDSARTDDNAVPLDVYHHVALYASSMPQGLTAFDVVTALWEQHDRLERIVAGHSLYLDANLNRCGRLTDAAQSDWDDLHEFLTVELSERVSWTLWEAIDWFSDGGALDELKVGMTDDEVAELAKRLTDDARTHERAVVNDVERYLERTLSHMRDEAERGDD